MRELPVRARLYVCVVMGLGLLVVVSGLRRLTWSDLGQVAALCALVVLSNFLSSPLRMGRLSQHGININVSLPVTVASVMLLGVAGAPIVCASIALTPRTSWFKRAFNGGMGALQAWVAATAYHALGGVQVAQGDDFAIGRVIIPVLVAAVLLEVVNGLLMMALMFTVEGASPLRLWFGTLSESALPMFIYSIFGLLLAVVWSYVGVVSSVLVLAPLMVARWVFAEFSLRQEAYEATMRSLIKSVETKDMYTRGHSERVSRASVLIGRRAGMREDRVATLRYAGMLHDVGKLGVPTSVLQKAGRLTEAEFEAIQKHPLRGREITKDLEFLGEAVVGILYHHERIDGRGYPEGLKGAEIPEFARIIAVADAFDSMTTTRSYRGARSLEDAVVELRVCKGSQFDPVMVEALVEAIESEGWDASDTLPTELPPILDTAPSFASDDDDPTAAVRLGLPSAAPRDASELDELTGHAVEERP